MCGVIDLADLQAKVRRAAQREHVDALEAHVAGHLLTDPVIERVEYSGRPLTTDLVHRSGRRFRFQGTIVADNGAVRVMRNVGEVLALG